MKSSCLLPLVVCLLSGSTLAADPATNVSGGQASPADLEFFEKKIRPLLHKRCYECHSQQAKGVKGGLRLDTRGGLMQGGDSGPAVVPGKPEESLLISAIRYGGDSYQMPPRGKLPDAEIAELVAWVRRGAPFPESAVVADTASGIDFTAAKKFWSFQPLGQSPLPEVEPVPGWGGRVDTFLLAAMRERRLSPSPSADRRTLIRRLSFDLIGLPPSPEEVDAFVADESSDAYQRLVERLLASPHYGERWGRHWLDLARYTDATASWLDSTAQAHLYRDWVVTALNQDVPYDEFVTRQLATDLMESTGAEDRPALGFLGLSPTYWKELKLPAEIIKVIVADEWEERIDAVSRTFLGLTVACARCHDHKFDPIGTEDYYALAGVFASTRLGQQPIIPAEEFAPIEAARKQVADWETQLKKLRKENPKGSDEITALEAKIAELKQATPNYDTPLANVVSDASLHILRAGETPQSGTRLEYRSEMQDLNLFVRGNPNQLGPVVQRRFLRVLSDGEPKPFQQGSGRLELARAIFTDAGPLAARVIVNRVWLAHFGRGLVETPSNFGAQGSRPSHPELLDDLAAGFVEHGWSLKWLHRQLVQTAAYRQTSDFDSERQAIDPDNRWLWRMNRRRLDVESWRDAMLSVSGQLDRTLGGASLSLNKPENRRRTLYGTIHRREMPAMLQLHDFPAPSAHSPQRVNTTTALQGLFALNSPLMISQAEALSRRVREEVPDDLPSQVRLTYQLLFGRAASEEEVELAASFLAQEGASWPQYAQALLASNEFAFVD